jgi:hypothetical protein
MVNDGHTRVRQETLGNHILPVRLHFFVDGLYVVSAAKAYAGIVGGRMKKIGLMSAQDAYAAVRPLVSVDGDNESRRRLLAVDLLVTPEVLQAIGATKSADLIDLTVRRMVERRPSRCQRSRSGRGTIAAGRWSRGLGSVRASTPGTSAAGCSILTALLACLSG